MEPLTVSHWRLAPPPLYWPRASLGPCLPSTASSKSPSIRPLTVDRSYATDDFLSKATSMEPLTVSSLEFFRGPLKRIRREPLTVVALIGPPMSLSSIAPLTVSHESGAAVPLAWTSPLQVSSRSSADVGRKTL